MTFKQKIKLINLIFAIVAVVGLFLPNIKCYGQSYNTFKLINENGFKFLVLLLIIFDIVVIAGSLMTISIDKNKVIPLIVAIASLIGFILSLSIIKISGSSGNIIWNSSKYDVGTYLIFIPLIITFLLMLLISIRSYVFKKNDDDYIDEEETVDEEETIIENVTTDTENQEYLLDEFDNK